MARRPNPATGPVATEEHKDAPSIPGGTPGVIEDAVKTITDPTKPIASVATVHRENAPRAKRYRVLNGGSVMYGNCRTAIKAGKIVDDSCYDITTLLNQGIQLQEVTE